MLNDYVRVQLEQGNVLDCVDLSMSSVPCRGGSPYPQIGFGLHIPNTLKQAIHAKSSTNTVYQNTITGEGRSLLKSQSIKAKAKSIGEKRDHFH